MVLVVRPSALVAWGEFARYTDLSVFDNTGLVTIGLSIFIGALTFTGSFVCIWKATRVYFR